MFRGVFHFSLTALFTFSQIALWAGATSTPGGWYFWPLLAINSVVLCFMWYTLGYLMHEGSHRHLSRSLPVNEIWYRLSAHLLYGSPTFFRVLHLTHHGFANSPKDLEFHEELLTADNRRQRRRRIQRFFLLAGFETIRLQYRFLAPHRGAMQPAVRRRCQWEFLASAVLIGSTAILWTWSLGLGSWLIAYLLPWAVAAWAHGWDAVVQHYGMASGHGVDTSRDVIPQSAMARFLYWMIFNENYHSAHHHAPTIPAAELPRYYERWMEKLRAEGKRRPPVFPSYTSVLTKRVIPALLRDYRRA